MKPLIKRLLSRCGWSLQRLPRGIVTGTDLGRDLRLVVGPQHAPLCVDVGANHGDFITLLHACLESPTVHAFEPNPTSFAALQTNHRATRDVHLNHAGLAANRGTLTLHLLPNHALNSFLPLSVNGLDRLGSGDVVETIPVPVVSLDDYAAQASLSSIDLLKIDTQGFELNVLRGANALFAAQRIRTVLVELDFADLYVGQATPADIITFLHGHGLRLVDFYEKCRHSPLLGWCTALFTRADARPPP